MKQELLALTATLCLLTSGAGTAVAQKGAGSKSSGGSASGRSYSSGSSSKSSSSSRPSSSGKSYASGSSSSSSSQPKSSSGGSSSSGKSYSSGTPPSTPSKPPALGGSSSTPGKPSSGSSTSRPAPSGSGNNPNPPSAPASSKPSGSYDRGAGGAQPQPQGKSSTSGKQYSSGAPPAPSSAPQNPASDPGRTQPAGSGAAKGKSFSQGNKPAGGSYDTAAAEAQRKQESKTAYVKGQAPKPEYKVATGQTRPIDPKDTTIRDLRDQLDHERWTNREQRQRQYYGGYYSRPPVVYADPYPSFFWWWMLDQSIQRQALWAYHHRASMDDLRYQQLLARDARLEAEIRALEARGVARDATYVPPGMDRDLMYSDDYVDAAYNPQPAATPVVSHSPARGSGIGKTLLIIVVVGGLLALAVWLVFFKRWGGATR